MSRDGMRNMETEWWTWDEGRTMRAGSGNGAVAGGAAGAGDKRAQGAGGGAQ